MSSCSLNKSNSRLVGLLLLVVAVCHNNSSKNFHVSAYVAPDVQLRWKQTGYNIDKALVTIEECAELGDDGDEDQTELYHAVRFIDRNAHKIYRTVEEKEALWERAKGAWELRLAYEDSRTQYFYPYPDFRDFAMAFVNVEDDYFGKGIAKNPNFCFVAMGGPAKYNPKTRQLYMNYEDFYISGKEMPDWDLSYFMRGYARNWYPRERKRPPLSFTLIAASDTTMVVRGSKTGGMAIFRRIEEAMTPAAYGR